MNPDPTRDDLQYLRNISEQGRYAPLLGGRFLMLWGSLIAFAYVGEYAILSGRFGLPPISMLFMWSFVMVAGILGMKIMGRQVHDKPGNQSIGNQVERKVWLGVGISIGAYAWGVVAATLFAGAPPILFDLIIAVAFGGYGAAHFVMSRIAKVQWMQYAAFGSFAGAFMVPFLAGKPILYLYSAAVVIAVAVVPGILLLTKEPAPLPKEA